MQLTTKIKIEPTQDQIDVLWKLSERCRLIYNFALAERREVYKNNGKISYTKQQNDLPLLKTKYPEYKWVYSKVMQMTLKKLDADYKSFFALKRNGYDDARPPGFKGRKYFTTMTHNQSGFKFYNNKVKLSHKYNDVTLDFTVPDKFDFTSQRVYEVSIFIKDDNYYMSIVYDEAVDDHVDNESYQAFDLGSFKHQAVNISGKFIKFDLARPDKHWNNKTEDIQSRRDHCKKYSREWSYLNKIIKKWKRKSSNQLKDFQHKLTRKIIDNTRANTIIVGDMSVKKMCQLDNYKKELHKSMHNTGNISRFVGFLTYKAIKAGKKVIEIDESYTTKMCCCCSKEHDMPLTKRVMKCDCGNVMDRDENSSINIMLRYLSTNGLWTAYQQFVDNLRQTGILIGLHSQEAPTSAF